MSETLQHLVLVRHGEGEGDLRRAAWRRGEKTRSTKLPEMEELVPRGEQQCHKAGLWIAQNIIRKYGLLGFDGYYVSPALRSEQSAVALDLPAAVWQEDNSLDERHRGLVRGLHRDQHKHMYPESYKLMKSDPLHWLPPDGEAILPDVVNKVYQFLMNIEGADTVIAVTHRDWMWAAQQPLEGLSDDGLTAVITDDIHNAQIIHYTSVNPATGEQAPDLLWKFSVDPMHPEASAGWQVLPNAARTLV